MPPFLLIIQLSRCSDIVCNKHKMQKKTQLNEISKALYFVSPRFIYFTYNLLHYNASKVTLENHITVNLCINAINIAPKYLNSRTTTTKNWVLMCNIGLVSFHQMKLGPLIFTHTKLFWMFEVDCINLTTDVVAREKFGKIQRQNIQRLSHFLVH